MMVYSCVTNVIIQLAKFGILVSLHTAGISSFTRINVATDAIRYYNIIEAGHRWLTCVELLVGARYGYCYIMKLLDKLSCNLTFNQSLNYQVCNESLAKKCRLGFQSWKGKDWIKIFDVAN